MGMLWSRSQRIQLIDLWNLSLSLSIRLPPRRRIASYTRLVTTTRTPARGRTWRAMWRSISSRINSSFFRAGWTRCRQKWKKWKPWTQIKHQNCGICLPSNSHLLVSKINVSFATWTQPCSAWWTSRNWTPSLWVGQVRRLRGANDVDTYPCMRTSYH